MKQLTYWMPISIATLLKIGFSDFKEYYNKPLFIRVNKSGSRHKKDIIAVGCSELPENAQIILRDYELK